MRNRSQKLAKGHKTEILVKLCGFMNREAMGPSGLFERAIHDGSVYLKSRDKYFRLELISINEPTWWPDK